MLFFTTTSSSFLGRALHPHSKAGALLAHHHHRCRHRRQPLCTASAGRPWELPPSWSAALTEGLMDTPELQRLQQAVADERARTEVLPSADETFAAFEACAFEDVRVVILGQDPYPTPGHAMGLSFSVRPGVAPPASLKNIYAELQTDLGIAPAGHGCLRSWASQGVFLLNSALSVRAGEAGSHANLGWGVLTDAAIQALSDQRRGLVFLLWGKAAEGKARLVDDQKHALLGAPHPSPLSARRGFFGCRHFSRANCLLEAEGLAPIAWALPPLAADKPTPAAASATATTATASTATTTTATEGRRISEEVVLVFDTETTGLDAATERVVQLGAAYWRGAEQLGSPRGMLVDPGMPIPPEASAVHGVSDDAVEGAPPFAVVGARFVRHLTGDAGDAAPAPSTADGTAAGAAPPLLCGYNALEYDVPLLNAEFARHGLGHRIATDSVLDPLVWLRYHRRHWPSLKLGAVAARFDHALTNAHSASADAAATGAVLCGLVAEGIIPDDVDAALSEQARLRALLRAETDRYGYTLYEDRHDGALRLGFGKHGGARLAEVAPDYLRHVLGFDGLPEAATEALRRTLGEGAEGPSPVAEATTTVAAAQGAAASKKRRSGGGAAGAEKGEKKGGGSATDAFETDEAKLAYRMGEGMFSVVEGGTGDAWLAAFHPSLAGAAVYVVKPGRGGLRYLGNVAGRLNNVGFEYDHAARAWVRQRVIGGVERPIDLVTLQPREAVTAALPTPAAMPPAPPTDATPSPAPAVAPADGPQVERKSSTGLPVDFWDN